MMRGLADRRFTEVDVPVTEDRPVSGGRYDIGGPPERARFYPGAVTLVRNDANGRWIVDAWTIVKPPESLACFRIRLTEAAT